eukprot:CAMPEP_0197848928 /NCGR_PEP_ID=MMETSP1438-20131217/10536_1 /TAXON_ID=1461541 /ORGANISM="Pterosperma sp., Strain CCMP1384" /LENGTH=221 /DNA_ID=CAMNT_0043461407 /DNA_START=132 /DNA_END=797 /DNA_ORIENTATION=-
MHRLIPSLQTTAKTVTSPLHDLTRCAASSLHTSAASLRASSSEYPPPNLSRAATADLCDVFHPEDVDVITPNKQMSIVDPGMNFRDYGGLKRFSGTISTIKTYENNPLVRAALSEPGNGRVLVVDGGGSLRCALLGDNLAEIGATNGWHGVVINGCVRDAEDIARMDIGVKALNTHPLKSSKRDPGLRDVPVTFGGVTFTPGEFISADHDGIIVAPETLTL